MTNLTPQTGQFKEAQAHRKTYLRTKVMTASPEELRLMLFDGAIRFAEQAREGLALGQSEQTFEGISRCQAILLELINSLRPQHDQELCDNLSALYTYLYSRLIHANTERDVSAIDEVLQLLKFERETWVMLMDKLAQENSSASHMPSIPQNQPHQPLAPHGLPSTLVGGNLSVQG